VSNRLRTQFYTSSTHELAATRWEYIENFAAGQYLDARRERVEKRATSAWAVQPQSTILIVAELRQPAVRGREV